jgi:hypothetical protein
MLAIAGRSRTGWTKVAAGRQLTAAGPLTPRPLIELNQSCCADYEIA